MNRRRAFWQLILVRVREFYREPEVIFWVYGFPLILAVLLGMAFSTSEPELPAVDVGGVAGDPRAEAILATLQAAKFKVVLNPLEVGKARFKKGKTAVVVVPQDNEGLEYLHDPARPDSVLARYWVDAVLARSVPGQPTVRDVVERGPGNRYIDFLLPGLIGLNIMGGGLFGVGFFLVDVRVRKLFKRLLATPMHRGDFLLSVLTARLLFLVPEMLFLLLFGWLAFGVPVRGSLLLLLAIIFLGASAFAGLGLLLGCRTEKTETMSGLISLVMLPSYLLAGVFFSSNRFPDYVQPLVQALPLTHVNDAMRSVMLDGGGIADVGWHLVVLAAWATITFFLAGRWFRWA